MTKTSKLHEVIYVSTIAADAPLSVVADIAGKARIANEALHITGLLIFDGMHFCQQLEGNQKDVLALIERIQKDPRHSHMTVVYQGPLQERRFERFCLGYTYVADEDVLAQLALLNGQAVIDAFLALHPTLDLDA